MKKQAQKPKLGQAPLVTPIKMQVRRPSFPFPAFPRVVSIIAVSAIIAHIVSVYLLLRLFVQKHSAVYPFNLPHPGGRLRLKDVVLGNDKRSAREFFFNHLDDFCNECDFEFYRRYLRRIPCCNSGADFVIGGLNEGDLSDVFLERCTGHIHGFEIQKHYFEQLLLYCPFSCLRGWWSPCGSEIVKYLVADKYRRVPTKTGISAVYDGKTWAAGSGTFLFH